MYQSQLSREAKLIVQGRQEWVRGFAAIWSRLIRRLGIGGAKTPVA